MEKTPKDIPGFYYDAQKKKYFKVNSNYPGPPKQAVDQSFDEDSSHSSDDKKITFSVGKRKIYSKFSFLQNRCCSTYENHLFVRKYHALSIMDKCWPDFDNRTDVLNRSSLYPGDLDYNIQVMAPNPNHDGIAIVSKIVGQERSLFQMYRVSPDENENVKVKLTHMYPDFVLEQISSICWNPHDKDENTVLLSTLLFDGGTLLLYSFNNMQDNDEDRPLAFRHERYRTRIGCIWTAKWNPHPSYEHMIGLGTYGGFALRTIGCWRNETAFRIGSDVFAIDFGTKNHTLFCGSRDGKVRMFDLRSLHSVPRGGSVLIQTIGKSLDWIKLLKDEEKMVISTLDGRLELWDLRMHKCLRKCLGHNNTHTRLSPCVFPDEEFVYAVGEDKIGRIWHLNSGSLLKKITYPGDLNEKTVNPCLVYGDNWGGEDYLPGFIYGVKKSIFFHHL